MAVRKKLSVFTVVLVPIFLSAIAVAEDLPTSLEELERYEASHLVDESATSDQVTSSSVLKQFNLHIKRTKFAV